MSTGGAGADSGRLYKYGASHAGHPSNGDLTEEQAREINARYRGTDKASKSSGGGGGNGGSGILHSLREALRPGDSRRPETGRGNRIVIGAGTGTRGAADDNTTHGGGRGRRHESETMPPGKPNYHDASEEEPYDHRSSPHKTKTGSSCDNDSSSGARRRSVMGTVKQALAGGRDHGHHHESYRDATVSSSSSAGGFGSSPGDKSSPSSSSSRHKGGGESN